MTFNLSYLTNNQLKEVDQNRMLCAINVHLRKYMDYPTMAESDKEGLLFCRHYKLKIKLNLTIKTFFLKNCIPVKMYVFQLLSVTFCSSDLCSSNEV